MAQKTKKEVFDLLNSRKDYLYKEPCLTRQGYMNWCIEYLYENEIVKFQNNYELKNIDKVCRNKTYNHIRDLKGERPETSNRNEEWFVLDMVHNRIQGYDSIFGEILNYQIPLKDNLNHSCGKIDFASYFENELLLVEIKAEYCKESILKAILEIQSYYQIVDKQKLLKDFDKPQETKIRKVVSIFENSTAFNQLQDKLIKELISKFDIEIKVLKLSKTLLV